MVGHQHGSLQLLASEVSDFMGIDKMWNSQKIWRQAKTLAQLICLLEKYLFG